MKTRRGQKRVRHTRKGRGGKFVFQGAYGCTFRPAIKCKGNADRAPGKVSKLMDGYEAYQEYKFHDMISPLDPDEKYFIVPSRMCKPEITQNPENNYSSCSLINIKNKYIDPQLLLSTEGGKDLMNLVVFSADLYTFLKGLTNLFEGLIVLHTNEIAHLDIKPSNLVGLKTDTEYVIRYIDFGLSTKFADFRALRETYPYWPFDARLVDPYYANAKPERLNPELEEFYKSLKYGGRSFPNWLWYNEKGKPIVDKNLVNIISELIVEKKIGSKSIIEGCDIFALGRTLSEVYSRNTGHYYVENNKIEYSGLPNKYQDGLRDAFSLPFYNLIAKMAGPIVFERPSARMALQEYIQILERAKEFFNDS